MSEVISIKAQEVQEWLILRRKLEKNWFMKYSSLMNKQKELINSMKQDGIKNEIINQDSLNFSQVQELKSFLEQSHLGQQRNFLNQYSNVHIKNWNALIRVYQKNYFDLASLSQKLNEILNYSLPSNKKIIKENGEIFKDFEFKISTCLSSINFQRKEIVKKIKQYNEQFEIEHENAENFQFNVFIRDFVYCLCSQIESIEETVQQDQFKSMINYYLEFSQLNNGQNLQNEFELILNFASFGDHFEGGKQIQNKKEYYDSFLKTKGYFKDDDFSIFETDTIQEQKQSILLNRENRESLLDTLQELFYFYQQRLNEQKDGQFFDCLEINQKVQAMKIEQIKKFLKIIKRTQDAINDRKLNQILSLLEAVRNKVKIQESFQTIIRFITKNKDKIKYMENKKIELEEQNRQAKEEISTLNREAVNLKNDITKLLEEKFKVKFVIQMALW